MNPLPVRLNYQGRELSQISRSPVAAIYEVRGLNGMSYGYEVIVIKQEDDREAYPAGEEWGTLAWSYSAIQRKEAKKRFDYLSTHKLDKDTSILES